MAKEAKKPVPVSPFIGLALVAVFILWITLGFPGLR